MFMDSSLSKQLAPCRVGSGQAHISPAVTSDADLIEAIAEGDKGAMQILFARHNVKVYRFALRLVSDEMVAEDVVNEVFFDVWRQARMFEGRSLVSTWLLSIARNKAMAKMRRRRRIGVLDDDAWESIEDATENPESGLRRKQQGSILVDCLKRLSPAHREIIDLVYYHEKSIDEVAEIIHAPRNTVKTRMFYARQKLAELLDCHGVTTAMA